MKSPLQRSKRYREGVAGNIKMRGKKCILLGCKCCSVIDFRNKMIDNYTMKEIKEYVDS